MTTNNIHRTVVAVLAFITLLPGAAVAQSVDMDSSSQGLEQSRTRGFHVNLRTGGYGVAFENDDDGTGMGGGLRLGYGLTDRFTLYAGLEAAGMEGENTFEEFAAGDDFHVAFIELGGRYHFRPAQRWVPFADASLAIVGLAYEKDQTTNRKEVTYGGLGASLGGGLLYFVSRKVALEGMASFVPGNLSDRTVGSQDSSVDVGMANIRMTLGISFYPFQ